MRFYFLFLIVVIGTGCAVSNDPQRPFVRKLQKGIITEDTSFVYMLPYEPGSSRFVIQGYYSRLSHRNRVAVDFRMKKRTTIVAARSGVVSRVKSDGKNGGLKKEYRREGNHIVIDHNDGSRAGYWHLIKDGALVKVGDTVLQGQPIALSGNTGYSAFPHLHFITWKNEKGRWTQIPSRFQTKKGPRYLRPYRFYSNPASRQKSLK